jgi:hypothetical protein
LRIEFDGEAAHVPCKVERSFASSKGRKANSSNAEAPWAPFNLKTLEIVSSADTNAYRAWSSQAVGQLRE